MAASRQSTMFPQGILLALVAALAFAAAPASAAAAELEFQFNLTVTGTVPAAETLQLFFDSTAIKSGPTVFLFCAPDVPPQPPQGPQIAPCRGNGTPVQSGARRQSCWLGGYLPVRAGHCGRRGDGPVRRDIHRNARRDLQSHLSRRSASQTRRQRMLRGGQTFWRFSPG